MDDYADIVAGARKDAENHPAYDSGYYQGGYPPAERAAAAREEAHVRREREKSVASRNRRQRKNVQLAKR